MNRSECEQKIIMKALRDPNFKSQLIANPKEAIKECLKNEKGFNPNNLDRLNINISQDKQSEWTIHLPELTNEQQNLSDAELEKLFAAGGSSTHTFTQAP